MQRRPLIDETEWTEAAEKLAKTSEEPERGSKFIPQKAQAEFAKFMCLQWNETNAPIGFFFFFFLSYVSFSKLLVVFFEAQHSWDSWDISHPLRRGEFRLSVNALTCLRSENPDPARKIKSLSSVTLSSPHLPCSQQGSVSCNRGRT